MRLSSLPLTTLKEVPAEAELASHQLMLRAGLIRRLASGLFTWMPIGLRVLRRVEAVVREEMHAAGAHEILMPAVQPAELWQETGRWDRYGPLLLRMRDRHEREFCFGPTHEEVITDIARRELRSYRQLPVNWYQIQTKFRDEIRPRFGLMRAREFLMKDAYSFHLDAESLQNTYDTMAETYSRIFARLGIPAQSVEADSGEIGGARSREFHVLADSGEDAIAFSAAEDFAMNVELAPTQPPAGKRPEPAAELREVATPDARSIEQVCEQLAVDPRQTVKTLVVEGQAPEELVALVLRGDHALNPVKAGCLDGVRSPLTMAAAGDVERVMGAAPGSVGPVGSRVRVVADAAAAHLADFVCGANRDGYHLAGVNWGRDLPEPEIADLRNIVSGDPGPGGHPVTITRGIEVGHIFQLGEKYSASMGATVLDENGREQAMLMGCYGIGISRIVAAAVEQSHDDRGIVWPAPMAPFDVVVLGLNVQKSEQVRSSAESIYANLSDAGAAVLYDDRDARPGVKFADADLLGVPHQIVVGERGLSGGVIEYRHRAGGEPQEVALAELDAFMAERLAAD